MLGRGDDVRGERIAVIIGTARYQVDLQNTIFRYRAAYQRISHRRIVERRHRQSNGS